MYCKKCGYGLKEDDKKCPFCGANVENEEEQKIIEQPKVKYCKKCGCRIDNESGVCPYCESNKTVSEEDMSTIRNASGFINLNTKWWHHLLIACGGYLLMEFLFTFIGSFVISIYIKKGNDFSCIETNNCSPEVLQLYTKIASICQVVCELIIILIICLIFRKYIKQFFNEAKDKKTWVWYGIGVGLLYGGNIIYNIFLELIRFTPADSANQEGVVDIIQSSPLFGLLFVVIAAPIFEELIFRFGLFRCFENKGKKMEIIGVAVVTFAFAFIHMFATISAAFKDLSNIDGQLLYQDFVGSFPIYLIGAFALTFTYYKSKNLMASICAHMTVNLLSFIGILGVGSNGDVGESVSQFIQLITRLLF